jgi:hypothetical protein
MDEYIQIYLWLRWGGYSHEEAQRTTINRFKSDQVR